MVERYDRIGARARWGVHWGGAHWGSARWGAAALVLLLAGCQSTGQGTGPAGGQAGSGQAGAASTGGGAVASADATPGAKSKAEQPPCFFTRDIDGWNSIDPYTVRIRVGVNKRYDLKLFMPQPDLSTRLQLAIVTKPGGSDWVCSPMDIEIIGEPLHLRVPVREIIAVPPEPKKPDAADKDTQNQGGGAQPGAQKDQAPPQATGT
ncbi:DUF6491 family protein [Nitrospirillum sp. BR 11828]|uniref:DUF6491 family protein n=1 Tax=Nitrospirillum sp. BR 11828 TaxID=3104325 RepID=UPI002AC9F8BE|nr:DUF6491 family protein [Nitrospirillum sp. BR 11828]MDZ5649349.1 DUF6491 family protein [Nitrospirillum sp. BR 11828]